VTQDEFNDWFFRTWVMCHWLNEIRDCVIGQGPTCRSKLDALAQLEARRRVLPTFQ
jgi:hypothetical protein